MKTWQATARPSLHRHDEPLWDPYGAFAPARQAPPVAYVVSSIGTGNHIEDKGICELLR